jgi:hypothetical protein
MTDVPFGDGRSGGLQGSMTNGSGAMRGIQVISPAQHAVLDYAVAATFLGVGIALARRHRPASALAFLNGGLVLGMSLLTNYPGGAMRKLSFKTHRTGDIIQAGLAAIGPALFGFGNDPEAKYFYSQALSEAGVIAATDWNAAR